ncbi:XdhC family protein [Thalassotalea mangrovi]|uniref:XdhC family protein n=1 Tax=Thalassotalea mangrovi TaxID=2572245 RepID=A0A4U1B2J3_9GAMM|nr:XdhC family protein [Thalassotalea mangrovi]TKB43660.1 XdhC family protein [Thalassotalea mangrovi]
MQLTDLDVLRQANVWFEQHKSFWMCTIIGTYGSAPRPIGSIFITDGNQRVGSISGGCLEDAFVEMLERGEFEPHDQIFVYGKHLDDTNVVKELPCGGTIRLLVEPILQNTDNRQHLQQWLAKAEAKKPCQRIIDLSSKTSHKQLIELANETAQVISETETTISLTYGQVWSLLLLGVGQVTQHVAELGIMAGYDVRLCDMRKELADSWTFTKDKGGVDIEWRSPDEFIEQYANERSAVLALAHDPRIDDVGLMTVFETKAFYIGAMGSSRTSDKRQERLQRICGFSDKEFERLHAPIGLPIGSKTPVEIAIAIMADIIRVRNGKPR